jgi:hypothetical protein
MISTIAIIIGSFAVGLWVGSFSNRLLNSVQNSPSPAQESFPKINTDEMTSAFNPDEISSEERSDLKEKFLKK